MERNYIIVALCIAGTCNDIAAMPRYDEYALLPVPISIIWSRSSGGDATVSTARVCVQQAAGYVGGL